MICQEEAYEISDTGVAQEDVEDFSAGHTGPCPGSGSVLPSKAAPLPGTQRPSRVISSPEAVTARFLMEYSAWWVFCIPNWIDERRAQHVVPSPSACQSSG